MNWHLLVLLWDVLITKWLALTDFILDPLGLLTLDTLVLRYLRLIRDHLILDLESLIEVIDRRASRSVAVLVIVEHFVGEGTQISVIVDVSSDYRLLVVSEHVLVKDILLSNTALIKVKIFRANIINTLL